MIQNRFARTVIAGVFLITLMGAPPQGKGSPIPLSGSAEVYFSPHGGATEAIIREIDSAGSEILVQAYSFTSVPIARALLAAKKRGVAVEVVLDKSQRKERHSTADYLRETGIPVWMDDRHAIAHSKIMIIDRQTLVTGSFNFTKAAEEKNAENLLVIKGNKQLIDIYRENFEEQRGHADSY